ncbi:DUF3144 domain-containing protein [Pseudoteredinibacter isoporae]|uniref:DUF3144 domain-containing protein n=1 Tax=Pseudoteredinibacter isoporae TaxID=570281 RepID=UPI003103B17C
MSDQDLEQLFWSSVEESLSLANEKAQDADPGVVSEALMYAAARFATFIMAANSETQEDFVEDRSEYFKHLAARFRTFLDDNLDDYGENYHVLLERPNTEDDQ